MINLLEGRAVALRDGQVTLMTSGGVGYAVLVPRALGNALEGSDHALLLYIETMVKEGEITLVGFDNPADREIFRVLNKVQGVGAKVALSLLDLGSDLVVDAVMAGHHQTLSRAQGVGPRLAQRLCSEASAAMAKLQIHLPVQSRVEGRPQLTATHKTEALRVLVSMGYGRHEMAQIVRRSDGETVQAVMEDAMRSAARPSF